MTAFVLSDFAIKKKKKIATVKISTYVMKGLSFLFTHRIFIVDIRWNSLTEAILTSIHNILYFSEY